MRKLSYKEVRERLYRDVNRGKPAGVPVAMTSEGKRNAQTERSMYIGNSIDRREHKTHRKERPNSR